MSASPNIESRLAKIESLLEELLGLMAGQQPPGRYEYERALKEASRGNRKPLYEYIAKGGRPGGISD